MAEYINNNQNQDQNKENKNSDEVIHILAVPTLLDDLMEEMFEGPGKFLPS